MGMQALRRRNTHQPLIVAHVIHLERREAGRMMIERGIPGHATLNELTTLPQRTVYHVRGTPAHDYRIWRNA